MAKYNIIPSSRTIEQSPISIGHKAEKGVEAIEFDLTAWVETYGSGTLTVIMRRWGDAIPYPIALEIDENNKATWTLSDIDTAKAGMAYAQLNYIVGDEVVKKSDIYTFRVMDSLVGEGEPPEAYESWLEQLTHLAAEAMAEVLDIEGIVTDKTLTVDGGIADAKATGDALSALEDQFSEETDKLKADLDDINVSFVFNALNTHKATNLTGTEDLDNIKSAGVYLASTNSIASELTHSPTKLSFRLIVQYITAPLRLYQFILVNHSHRIYYRHLSDGTFGAWYRLSNYEESLSATNITVTPSNYLTYFPNGSYNDAMANAIYTINPNVPLTDAPDGNNLVGISPSSGYQFGTLITLSANNVDKTTQSTYVAQILIGYRDDRVSPTISYRIGRPTSLGFTWTKWSKLEENGVLHATNLIVYAGNTQYTFNDLNDAPMNGIVQIDLNMDGSDADHTLLHHPAPGVSCVAMTYAFSSATTHGKVQVVYTIDGRQYWRYGYIQAPGDYRWTKWSKLAEENGVLHATNLIVHAGNTQYTFNDLNDAPMNGIVQITSNMDGSDADHTLLHHPAPGVSCVAMTYAFSSATTHGKVQTVYTIDGRLYWRYGYIEAPGDYRWTSWQRVVSDAGDYLRNKGRLDNGTDLNTIKENAIYMLGGQSGANYVNNPITSGAGYLTAKHNSDVTLQIVESLSGTRYSRYTDDGTTWSNWI